MATGCSGGGGGGTADLTPTIITAAFVGGSSTPAEGDTLLLFFSEDVTLVSGNLLTNADVTLSGSGSLGTVTTAPTLVSARSVSVTLGNGVSFTPGVTTVALSATNDVVRDSAGQLGIDGTAVAIGTSDGVAPTVSNVTIAAIDDELNGTGPAGGTLQVPVRGWTIDLTYSDNGAISTNQTQVRANVAVSTSSGSQPAGTNLRPFLTQVQANNTAASYRVPSTVTFPSGACTISCSVIDASGLASNTSSFSFTVRAFTNALQPFETNTNAQQVWYIDFTRDVESLSTRSITNGIAVDVTAGANSRSDFEDVLHVLGLLTTSPIANVSGSQSSNDVVVEQYQTELLAQLALLYSGANVSFTLTRPSGSFGTNSSLAYNAIGYSQISIAGSSSSAGVLGVAIFDANNETQNDDTQTNFQGIRLGIFLQTIANAGMGPPSSSAFRLTDGPLAPSLGGTAIGADSQDGSRLLGSLTDSRATDIHAAITDLARFTSVVLAHECGHSMGLVQDNAMPAGLYGNDTTNFPGSAEGHIRNASLFPSGSTNVMSPSLSYSSTLNTNTAFNSLNLAYLREQVFYGN
jgi:hypothetical protein